MATGGSGDVLTGILLGLKAQGYNSIETSLLGVYLHGLAGDIAAKQKGQDSLIAGDITESLGKAWKYLR
jgi:ADP-dependent NAD(P)H-hydrate dehydratase / NAD(P)H-hydrate epimerase